MDRRRLLQTLAGSAAALSTGGARAQSVESFYKGKTITLFVATSPGGNYDLNGRLVSRHIGRFIPGNPSVVVQNVPGAGGLLLANRLANTVERDGLTMAIMERGTPQTVYEGDVAARFDPLKLTWIGSISSYENDAYLLLVNDKYAARSVDDLRKAGTPTRLGGDGPGSTNLTFAILARDLLKLNVQVIRGYHGAAPMFLAMQSGELDGQIIGLGSVSGAQQTLWNTKQVRPLLQFGRLTRHPQLQDIPTARELVTDPASLAMLEFAEIPFFMALPFVAPPDLPPERAQALRKAFIQMSKDPKFLEDAERSKFEISAIDGSAVQKLVQKMANTPKDVVKRYADLISKGRD